MRAEAQSEASPPFVLPAALLSQAYRLRPECDADIDFLMRLYASTRASELAAIAWTEAQKSAFCAQQFAAQRSYYRTTIEPCRYEVIEQRGSALGRLYLQETPARLHIVDIALLPQRRGQGLGTQILQALQALAKASGRVVSIMVERSNPALRLYSRLGFRQTADHGIYLEMEWRAS